MGRQKTEKYPLTNFAYILDHDPRTIKACGGSIDVKMFQKQLSKFGYNDSRANIHTQQRRGIRLLSVAEKFAHVLCYGFGIDIHPKELIGIRADSYTDMMKVVKRYGLVDAAESKKDMNKLNDWSEYI